MLCITLSTTGASLLQCTLCSSICGLFEQLTLVNFTTVQMNKHDWIQLCSQKIATWKSLRLRSKNTLWCRIGNWYRRFKTPTCFFRHPPRIFLQNFESQSSQERCAMARTSCAPRQDFFCVRIWYKKFPISDCIGDLDLGLCTFWVLAKREPLSKSNFRKRTRFARRKNQILPSLSGSLNASTQKEYRHRSQSPLHFDIRNS